MRGLLLVAVMAAGAMIGASAFAERDNPPGYGYYFGGPAGRESGPRDPWEATPQGTRPTFSGAEQTEPKAGHWFETLGRPVPSRAPGEGRSQRPQPVSVQSVEDRTGVVTWFDALGRR